MLYLDFRSQYIEETFIVCHEVRSVQAHESGAVSLDRLLNMKNRHTLQKYLHSKHWYQAEAERWSD